MAKSSSCEAFRYLLQLLYCMKRVEGMSQQQCCASDSTQVYASRHVHKGEDERV